MTRPPLDESQSEKDRRDAEEFANELAQPVLRSMYPSRSRGQMANEFKHVFISARQTCPCRNVSQNAPQSESNSESLPGHLSCDRTQALKDNYEAIQNMKRPANVSEHKPTPSDLERARELCQKYIETEGFDWVKYVVPLPTSFENAIAAALAAAREDTIEECAKKLDAAAEHHANADKHPAWDRTRSGDEPCDEHGRVYHSYPGYAAHVVAQMATVIRTHEKGKPNG